MNMFKTRMRRDHRFHSETLEDRNLLSAIPAATAEVQAAKTKLVTEVVQGTMTGTFVVHGSLVVIAAYGNLTNMGAAQLSGQYHTVVNFKTLKSTDTGGMAGISDSHGDGLIVKFTGTGKESHGQLVHSLKGTITGGGNKFNLATGTFTATSTSLAGYSGTFQTNVKLTVKLRR